MLDTLVVRFIAGRIVPGAVTVVPRVRDCLADFVASDDGEYIGMMVMARTDPHATYEDVYRDRPDWIAVDATGQKRRHWEIPEMCLTCAFGPYNFEFMTEVTREIPCASRPFAGEEYAVRKRFERQV